MTSTKELIQYLQSLPENTIINIVVADKKGHAMVEQFDLLNLNHYDFSDFSHIKILTLGSTYHE